MRNSFQSLLLIAGLCATAAAAPDQKHLDKSKHDDVHVTVTAGRGRLGVAVIQISEELRAYFGAPKDRGVLVDNVRSDSPAAKAGVRVGDVVLAVDGDAARSASDMLDALSDHKKGDRVTIDVLRGGKRVSLSATLDDDPGPRWQSFGDFKNMPKDFDWRFDMPNGDLQRQLDDAKKRIEELERRIDKLDRT